MTSEQRPGSWRVLLAPRLWFAGAMGFASGLPLLLTLTVLQAWLTAGGVDLTTIGFIGLVGLPYSLKFIWAPLLDRFKPLGFGRRRSWLLIFQTCLAASIALLGLQDPSRSVWAMVVASILVTFFSASQDVVIDAYRRETLADSEQGLGATFVTYGYRIGMLVASAGGLILADLIGFRGVYLLMAAVMASMLIVTVLAPEPEPAPGQPTTLKAAFLSPLLEFFRRYEVSSGAWLVLTFVLIFKLGDNIASHMLIPFYLQTGFSNTEIGTVAKAFGLAPLLFGLFVGGVLNLRLGLYRTLIVAGILQSISTAGFAVLAVVGDDLWWLAAVIGFENLSGGMGTAALLAFMAYLTDRRFTAAQFAMLSALATVPRALLTAPSGWLATQMGWISFFVFAALVAVPGLVLLARFRSWFPAHEPPGPAIQSS
jgi:PAT family beta-lactamase induction signal transducer AmpG